jgi:hypothetical protein
MEGQQEGEVKVMACEFNRRESVVNLALDVAETSRKVAGLGLDSRENKGSGLLLLLFLDFLFFLISVVMVVDMVVEMAEVTREVAYGAVW